MTSSPPLPEWAQSIRRKYVGGEAAVFVLHHNVFDEILYDGRWFTLEQFLTEVLLKDNKQTILVYDPSSGARYARNNASSKAEPLAANGTPEEALALIEKEIMLRSSAALIIPYAGTIAPPGDVSFQTAADRVAAIRLHRWSLSSELGSKDNIVFLLTESLVELNPKIVANPRVSAIEVPLPDLDVRSAVIRHVDPSIDPAHVQRLAEHASGLRSVQIAQILTPRKAPGLGEAERLTLIRSLLADSADAEERATKLAAITQGMTPEEIRHLINPSHPLPETEQGDPYAAVIELVHRRKREIIEKECEGLIEFVDARHDMDAVGGNEGIKTELMQIAAAIRRGDRNRVPMGLLFVGPMGTGKTFVGKCFVKESGLTAVTLKNIRSKWVGSSEANLEKVLAMVKALGPIILIIDEGDRSFGDSGENDGGTSSRIMARLKEFMSDTDNRGTVLFIMMTNRPDKLDVDIKRAGRLDRKIPFFYADNPQDVEAVLQALFRRYGLGDGVQWPRDREATSARLVGYSNADLEAVCLLALNLGGEDGGEVTLDQFVSAIDDYVPAQDAGMLEYMELLAVFEASRRSLLPARYRDMSREDFDARLRQLKLELRL